MTDPEMLSWLREAITADKAYWERWLTQGVIVRRDHGEEHVARCEAELAILDEHRIVVADRGLPEQGQSPGSARGYRVVWEHPTDQQIADAPMMWHDVHCRTCRTRPPCRTVSLLAAGYKHHPGYAEAGWGS